MSRNSFILFVILIQHLMSSAQNDPNRILAEAQRKLDSVMKNNPAIKKYADKNNQYNNQANIPTAPANISMATTSGKKPDTAILSKIKLPPRNTRALALIPPKPYTRPQLVTFLGNLKKILVPALQEHYGTEILNVDNLGSTGISNAAALAWGKERPDIALELALDAADKDPDDPNALNNLSGILTMCGMPFASVPILDYIRRTDPENSTVDNNLGQAYLAMGDVQKSETYLQQALLQSPDHPDANLSLARIAYLRGDRQGAQKYCEHSLRGGYYPEAWTMLKALDKKARLMDLIRHRYKQPDSFNPHTYHLPEQCTAVDQITALMQEYASYRKMLHAVKDKYQKMLKTEQDYIRLHMADQVMKTVHQQKSPFRPFGAFGIVVLGDIDEDYGDTYARLSHYDSNYEQQVAELKKEYEAQKKRVMDSFKDRADKAGEGNPDAQLEADMCKEENKVAGSFLPQFAMLHEARQHEWINQTKNYFNDYAFWCYIASIDDHQYHQLFYQLVIDYLTMLEKICKTSFIGCTKTLNTDDQDKAFEFGEGKCPYNAEIPIANLEEEKFKGFVGKIQLDCEQFGLELGEGLIFNLERKSGTGETTLAFGAGVSSSIPIVHVLEGGAKMQFYITMGGPQAFDIGVRYEAEMDIKGMNKPEQKAGMIIGINAGGSHLDTYGEGVLANTLADKVAEKAFDLKPETQVNKNIKMYNNGGSKKE